ncbi:MAG TPA: 3-phosphoshikimate 1-carboxyvinyltransferase [Spirochaetia bacterium]|nr:3-phosphoshikimate 1-carboxyvinyltransferase [Spirochaetia bacterium]
MDATFRAPSGIGGEYTPPPDKSITHRSLMLAAIGQGKSTIRNSLATGDCISTRRCLEALGCSFEESDRRIVISGNGLRGFREPKGLLDAENSGTTTRLLSGLLAGLPIFAVLTGDQSLLGRPMARVVEPLRHMGARIEGREAGRFAPLCFLPGSGDLAPLTYCIPVPSAQVKSCLLFAALRAAGISRLSGKTHSRDHTERMLGALDVRLDSDREGIALYPPRALPPFQIDVPGDLSSASFFIAAALISGRRLRVQGCGVNPTRGGFLNVVRRMGALVKTGQEGVSLGEPFGSVEVEGGSLAGARIDPEEIPELIDEIPLLAVLGLFCRGVTEVRGAEELRFKESDRLAMISRLVEGLGGEISVFDDGFAIEGPQELRAGTIDPRGDHRIAMSAAIAAAGVPGGVLVQGFECAAVSYPDFARDFSGLGGEVA